MSRGRLVVAGVLSVAAFAVPASAAAAPNGAAVEIRKAKTFSLALGATLSSTNVKRLAARDLIVVDGDDTSSAQVRRLQAKGAVVLGYLSVGTVESWRSWFPSLEDHRLEKLGDWDGERYTDLTSAEARATLVDTIAPKILAKGFDGLFLDNVDAVDTHPDLAPGMLDVVTRLSAQVHAGGGALMAQNADASIAPLLPLLDAWNREDPTGTYDFATSRYVATDAEGRRAARTAVAQVKSAGLLVTTTDYFAAPTTTAAIRAIRIACQTGAVPFVGDIDLKQVTARAPRC